VDYASKDPTTSALLELIDEPYEKGLLEWRLSTEAAVQFLSQAPERSFVEVSYSDFVCDPISSISGVLGFLGLDLTRTVRRFAENKINRKSDHINKNNLSDKEMKLGGKILKYSMSNISITSRYKN